VALLCSLCAPFFVDTVNREGPEARRGVVSYSALGSLTKPVELRGEWRLDWHTAPAPGASLYLPAPGDWKGAKVGGVTLPDLGAASYSLILRDLPAGRYTLHVPRFFGAVRVAVDGQVVSERGVYGLTRATSRAVDRSQDVTLISTGRDVRIRLDMAAFEHRDNGMGEVPVLGPAEAMARWSAMSWLQGALVLGSLLLMGCFGIVVALARPQERPSLYFALACICLMPLAAMMGYDNLMQVALPGMSFNAMLSFQILTSTVALSMAFLYVREMYPRETPRLLYGVLQGLNSIRFAIYFGAFLLADTVLLSRVSGMSASFRTVGFVALLGIVIAACVRRREGSGTFLFGLASFVFCLIYNDIVRNTEAPALLGYNLMPVGSLLLLFSQLLILAERWSGAIRSAEETNGELRQLLDVNIAIASEIQLDALLRRIVQVTSQIIGADRSSLFLHDRKTDELWSMVAEGVDNREIRFPANSGLAGDTFTRGMIANVTDAYADPRFNQAVDLSTGYRTKSVLSVPIITRDGRRLGVMQAFNRLDGKVFDDADISRMTAFAAQAAVAIENATLFAEVATERNYNDSILRSMSSGVVTLDREASVVKMNPAACAILGVEPEKAVEPETQRAWAANNPWLSAEITLAGATGNPKSFLDADLVTVRGDTISANISIVPLMADDAEQSGLLIIVEDISEGKRMQGAMRRFMTQNVVDQIMGREDELLFGAACQASVLFADIRNFTGMAEQLGPRDTVDMLNEIFTDLFEAVAASDGLLDKFMGDALMAVYGAPISSDRDPLNAVDSAVAMSAMLVAINARRAARGGIDLRLGVGIASGEVVAGTIGSPKRMDYTVIGDSVNLASRLEKITKAYGVGIVICEDTARAVGGAHRLRELDTIRVRGRTQPSKIFQVVTAEAPLSQAAIATYAEGRAAMSEGRWAEAIDAFEATLAQAPGDRPTSLMLERTRILANDPPAADWDGVWDSARAA
jgi:adenylate cyclase